MVVKTPLTMLERLLLDSDITQFSSTKTVKLLIHIIIEGPKACAADQIGVIHHWMCGTFDVPHGLRGYSMAKLGAARTGTQHRSIALIALDRVDNNDKRLGIDRQCFPCLRA